MTMHVGVLLIIGVGAFAGLLGAWFFQRLRIPQVVGYIVIGLIIGQTGLKLVDAKQMESLVSFNQFALGVIGFLVGGELKLDAFKKYGRQYVAILLGEGLLAFVLVGLGSGFLIYLVCHNVITSAASGLVFGAIASATDPASTIDVLWEYRARGVVTSALMAIVALDDALAMCLYGIGKSTAGILVGGGDSVLHEMGVIGINLGGAVVLGVVMGVVLAKLLKHVHQQDRALAINVGAVLLVIGISVSCDLDLILSTMALGMTLVNLAPHRSHNLFRLVRSMSIPVYVLFFVLVGARLTIGAMPWWMWALVGVYVVGRNVGKLTGSWLGGLASRAPDAVRKYCGLGLFCQGGVAIGLAIVASEQLKDVYVTPELSLASLIIFTITATTLVMQLTGPPMVKLAARKAQELGRNVTEEDVVAEWHVRDVMQGRTPPLRETDSLRVAVQSFSDYDQLVQPVVNAEGNVVGCIAFEHLKEVLPEQETWDWLVCADVVQPVRDEVTPDTPLQHALDLMHETRQEQIMVIDTSTTPPSPVGILDLRRTHHRINEEILQRQGTVQPVATAALA